MKRPLSINERVETEIRDKKFWIILLKMELIYKINKMGDNMDLWPIPISALKEEEMKLFQIY